MFTGSQRYRIISLVERRHQLSTPPLHSGGAVPLQQLGQFECSSTAHAGMCAACFKLRGRGRGQVLREETQSPLQSSPSTFTCPYVLPEFQLP
jgi:hypothetical protein